MKRSNPGLYQISGDLPESLSVRCGADAIVILQGPSRHNAENTIVILLLIIEDILLRSEPWESLLPGYF
jgi:hypothetical protein